MHLELSIYYEPMIVLYFEMCQASSRPSCSIFAYMMNGIPWDLVSVTFFSSLTITNNELSLKTLESNVEVDYFWVEYVEYLKLTNQNNHNN